MAEPNDNLSPQDIQQIEALLEPLNKNPQTSEELNPMAKVLREKLGFIPRQTEGEGEEGAASDEDPFGEGDSAETDEASSEEDSAPAFRDIESEDDDGIDLDELLNPGSTPKPNIVPEDQDPFADLGSEEPSTEEPSVESNPFAELGEAEAIGGDPFKALNQSAPDWDIDPFQEATEATPDLDSPVAQEEDDPFAGLGDEPASDPEPITSSAEDDPFADFGSPSPQASVEEPEPASDLGSDDPFASFGTPSPTEDDFGGFDQPATPTSDSFDDPFGDLGDSLQAPSFDDALEPSSGGFDDLAPSLDEIPVAGMEEDMGLGLDSDLDSLGRENEPPEEGLEEGLSDEDLAVIQRELVKYPPKLRRTIIDAIVNNRIPLKNQKEILELIKAQQKPEDVAQFLSSLLGEKVELEDTSGKFSKEGIPIIASKDAYTKEGAIRRRELIRKTSIYSAAAILLLTTTILLYEKVIRPFRADSYYAQGLELIEEYGNSNDALEKQKLLFDAENQFLKGEAILPHSLTQLNAYCMAYMKVGQYEKAFEKCFGKVEPDFGFEPEDKEHKRSWGKRVEVPNIGFAPKSKWNDAGIKVAGKDYFPELSFSLTSQDKVPRKVVKAGAYIVSRLRDDVHDAETYISLGKFHSFHRKDFIEQLPGKTTKQYKNDLLAIEYFKRVFTDVGQPDNITATAGIAKVYYNKEEFATAAKYYNDIIERSPKDAVGHGGILSTYIEMWKRDKNPQFVLNHHRQVRNALNIEDDLSLPVLAKLAAFYIDLDSEDVRIRYNINPEDQVSGMEIDDNVEYLLNIAYNKDGGSKFAEGYYQRGRYYFKTSQSARALKQLELSATHDMRHYLAILLMAEYYLKVENYDESVKLLSETDSRYELYKNRLGEREEDETLLEGKPGRISFNLGKIHLLESAGIDSTDSLKEFPGRKIYPERSLGYLSAEERERRNGLYAAQTNFKKALERGLGDEPSMIRECNYYLGWIDYMHGDFASALDYWANLPEEDTYNNPMVLLGKGHSFFYTKQYNASLGNYLKLKDDYERKEQAIGMFV